MPSLIEVEETPISERGEIACAGITESVSAVAAITAEVTRNFRRVVLIIFFLPSRGITGWICTAEYSLSYERFAFTCYDATDASRSDLSGLKRPSRSRVR
jgi:hypothetical protein